MLRKLLKQSFSLVNRNIQFDTMLVDKQDEMKDQVKKLYGLRKDYESPELKVTDMNKCPFDQFQVWFDAALQVEKGVEVNAMNLATVSNDGWPNNRYVLLKDMDKGGFVFFTNYDSAKGQELEMNEGKASACFYWPTLNHQVRIQGKCRKIDAQESDEYFNQRPLKARISAALSPQSQVIESFKDLEKKTEDLLEEAEKDKSNVKRPQSWGGYRLYPEKFEFWQGNRSRLHNRFVYSKIEQTDESKANWKICELAP